MMAGDYTSETLTILVIEDTAVNSGNAQAIEATV